MQAQDTENTSFIPVSPDGLPYEAADRMQLSMQERGGNLHFSKQLESIENLCNLRAGIINRGASPSFSAGLTAWNSRHLKIRESGISCIHRLSEAEELITGYGKREKPPTRGNHFYAPLSLAITGRV